ncbi:MAG: penicillin-binding protein [Anaerolineae bacterium]|nr:penicillin-binding protein [Anaerolineae bacterium]
MNRRQFLGKLAALGLAASLAGACAPQAATPTAQGEPTVAFEWPLYIPDPREIERVEEGLKTLRIYDRTGEHLLAELASPLGHSTYVSLDRIPEYLRQAVIVMEDRTFYTNNGVDWAAVGRAFLSNLQGEGLQGGSTITMQLVKNVLIPPEERYQLSYSRKMKEATLAMEVTRLYPGREGKDRILEWYLNTCFYGQHSYGVEAASQTYFGKHVWEISLAEAAMLTLLPQSPGLDPISNFEAAKARQKLVLSALANTGYITPEEAEAAWQEEIVIRSQQEPGIRAIAPHFVLYVRDLLQRDYGEDMYRLGMRVYTTLDVEIQSLAQRVVAEKIAEYGVPNNASNGAAVVIRPERGEIVAMVGSADYYNEEIDGQVNMALAPRQMGSSFKPYTYLAAFEEGYTARDTILDTPVAYRDELGRIYSPTNIDKAYHGRVTLRQALACSYNVPAVKLLDAIGVDKALNMARRLGITTLPDGYYGLSLTLGTKEIPLLDHTFAYSVFANHGFAVGQPVPEHVRTPGGREVEPAAILRIEDYRGKVIREYRPKVQPVVNPAYAYVLTHVLSDPEARRPAFGASARYLVLDDRPVATKTGSTDQNREALCMGYTPQYVVGTWIGNADRRPMNRLLGSTGAGPIYHEIMKGLHEGLPVVEFRRPSNVLELELCTQSGLLAGKGCPQRVTEVFAEGTQPTERCNLPGHARPGGPGPTAELPAEYEPPEQRILVLSYPQAGAVLSGVVPMIGTATGRDLWYHKVEYSLDGENWTTTELDYMKTNQVVDGTLALWDTTQMQNGAYWLKATYVDITGNYVATEPIQVTVEN